MSTYGPQADYEARFRIKRAAAANRQNQALTQDLQGRLGEALKWSNPVTGGLALTQAAAGLGRYLSTPGRGPAAYAAPKGTGFASETQQLLDTVQRSAPMNQLFQRKGVGSAVPGGQMRGAVPAAAPAPVRPGDPVPAGPGMGTPAAVVTPPQYARAEAVNRAYQQGGGSVGDNYWKANPGIADEVINSVGTGVAKAGTVGYSDRADIQEWMKAQRAKGPAGAAMVDRFLADQARKGLIRQPEATGVDTLGGQARQARAAGLGPEELAGIDAYTKGAEALPGGGSLRYSANQAPWARGANDWSGEPAYATNDKIRDFDLSGAKAVVAPPAQDNSLVNAATSAPWAGKQGAQPTEFSEGVGNFHTSDKIRAMNFSGDQALYDAKTAQAMATRPDLDAKNQEPDAALASDPTEKLLNEHIRKIQAGAPAYQNGFISGIWGNE